MAESIPGCDHYQDHFCLQCEVEIFGIEAVNELIALFDVRPLSIGYGHFRNYMNDTFFDAERF